MHGEVKETVYRENRILYIRTFLYDPKIYFPTAQAQIMQFVSCIPAVSNACLQQLLF